MKLQLWRNATLLLHINGLNILIDPMLGEKGSLGKFPMVDNDLLNPLVDLPFNEEELNQKLKTIDAVAVTHLHPDHWDPKAIELLDKNLPILCPEAIVEQISQAGFHNIMAFNDKIQFKDIEISLTKGHHGTGEIEGKMGLVNGFIFKNSEQTIYIVGDSIWCEEVAQAIDKYEPQNIIVAGGAATFIIGDPIVMTSEDIKKVCEYAPNSTVWVTHLETVSHSKEDRKFTLEKIHENGLEKRCFVLNDGEEVEFEV